MLANKMNTTFLQLVTSNNLQSPQVSERDVEFERYCNTVLTLSLSLLLISIAVTQFCVQMSDMLGHLAATIAC